MSADGPECLGLLLCDAVIEDKRTNKKSFIGVFRDIFAVRAPVKHPCMYIVATITNCLGHLPIEVQITSETDTGEEPLMRIRGHIESKNPLHVFDLVFELRELALPRFGQYFIEVRLNETNERISQRSFFLRQLPQSAANGGGGTGGATGTPPEPPTT